MSYPRYHRGRHVPADIEELVRELASRLLAGPTPVHAQLREQLRRAEITLVTLTGAGLYADFDVPTDVPPVEPLEMIGGEVTLDVEGLDVPAGSLVKVTHGRLAFVEIYTFGDIGWPDSPHVIALRDDQPLPIPLAPTVAAEEAQ